MKNIIFRILQEYRKKRIFRLKFEQFKTEVKKLLNLGFYSFFKVLEMPKVDINVIIDKIA